MKTDNQDSQSPAGDRPDAACSAAPFKALCAEMLQGRDWHKLTDNGRKLAGVLETEGYLTPTKGGFVGKIRETAPL